MLHSIVVSLSIVFGGPETLVTLDVNPTFIVNAPIRDVLPAPGEDVWFNAVTLPHLILLDESAMRTPGERALVLREEALHAEQWSALGPTYPIAYALTLGRAFEPYDLLEVRQHGYQNPDFNRMWQPTPTLAQRCPLIRINNNGLSILPCWTNPKGPR